MFGLETLVKPISAAVTSLMKPINTWQERKNQIAEGQHALDMAALEFKTQLVMNRESHNQSWEIESLRQPQKKGMQWITFLVFGAPFVVAWFAPLLVASYFTVSIATIPVWYQQMFIAIVGVIWGIAQLKDAASGISQAFSKKAVDTSILTSVDASKIIRAHEKFNVFSSNKENAENKFDKH